MINPNPNKPIIGIIDGGMHYHHDSIEREPLKQYFDKVIYLRDIPMHDLSELDILIIPCRTHAHWLGIYAEQLKKFMLQGGTLVVMGETFPNLWLQDIGYRAVETNFWWWLEEGAELGVKMSDTKHNINNFISQQDATYHLHGVFTPLAPNQKMLIETKQGECLMFEDVATYAPGKLIATTLDPFFHHGAFFMPATTRFLVGLFPWLVDSFQSSSIKDT